MKRKELKERVHELEQRLVLANDRANRLELERNAARNVIRQWLRRHDESELGQLVARSRMEAPKLTFATITGVSMSGEPVVGTADLDGTPSDCRPVEAKPCGTR